MLTSPQLCLYDLLICQCRVSFRLRMRLAPQTQKLCLAGHHLHQTLLLLAFQLLSTSAHFPVRKTSAQVSGTYHRAHSYYAMAVAEYNTTFRISRAQLAASKPAPFGFSLPVDLCLLGVGLCGTTLRGSRTQPNPVPFLLPNFAPQVLISRTLPLRAPLPPPSPPQSPPA